jgi:hypothetical protein
VKLPTTVDAILGMLRYKSLLARPTGPLLENVREEKVNGEGVDEPKVRYIPPPFPPETHEQDEIVEEEIEKETEEEVEYFIPPPSAEELVIPLISESVMESVPPVHEIRGTAIPVIAEDAPTMEY